MLWLALAAIILRGVLPAGWMPNPAAFASGTPIVICTTDGARTVVIDADGNAIPAEPADGSTQAHDVCVFAAAASLALASTAAVLAAPLPVPFFRTVGDDRPAPRAPPALPAQPRAPPHNH